MNVTVLDTVTGERKDSKDTQFKIFDVRWWTGGNGGCDCNRSMMFDGVHEEMEAQQKLDYPELEEWQSYCFREKRFIVINVDPMPEGYKLSDFNEGYPGHLVKEKNQ